jgi:diadenosine tetraphosphate (Ap4A) HIT family hydrolase
VVAELPSGLVHLKSDADYRGYCILICSRHVVELHEMTESERQQWIEDVARVGKAINDVCQPAKLNVSMLGNVVPHLHCHIMPRYPGDPEWGGPPAFRAPEQVRPLPHEDFEELRAALRQAMTAPA